MIDLHPKICNICGGEVEYIKNEQIYGRSYGSGYCYHCKDCDAYVGTHKPRPKEALGVLANKEMKKWKRWCHSQFDILWKGRNEFIYNGKIYKKIKPIMNRNTAYRELSRLMNINIKNCHFGYFDVKQLKFAYAKIKELLKGEKDD